MATKKVSKGTSGAEVAAGAAIAAAAVAGAAGYYFYGTKNAKKHRQAASTWAKGMKRDVEKGVKTLKKVDAKTVARIVDDAAAAYQGVRGVAAGDVRSAAKELKTNWKRIHAELAPSAQVKRAVKKVTKPTVTKKVAKHSKGISNASGKRPKAAPKKTVKKATKKATKKSR
jgi:hypothetical protein